MKNKFLILLIGLPILAAAWVWLWPRDAGFYFKRGVERFEYEDEDGNGRDLDGALADFNRVVRLNPKFAQAYRRRGQIEEMNGEPDLALADYGRAIELEPTNKLNYVSRATFWENHTNLDVALADLDRAIAVDPQDEMLYGKRAVLKRRQGDFSGMVADLALANEVFLPPPTNMSKIEWQFRDNDPERVVNRLLRMYDKALKLNPDFFLGYYHRGALKHLVNDLDGALEDFRRCADFADVRLKDQVAIHIWLVRMQQGETNVATAELLGHFGDRMSQIAPDWEVHIARFLIGQINEDEFLAAIDKENAEREESEVWFYSAMKHLLAGDRIKAGECFEKSRMTRTRPYVVAIASQIELERLNR